MQMMVRSISLILTTITVALLLLFGSITIDASSVFTYTYYVTLANGTKQIWKSDQEITLGTATGSYYYDPNTGMYIERGAPTRNVYKCNLTAQACILSWDGQEWVISLPVISCNANVDTMYHTVFCYNALESISTTKPAGFPDEPSEPDFDQMINDGISDVLNESTGVTEEAQEIEDEINDYLQKFNNGEISQESFLIILTQILSRVENLEPITLVDMEAVNNLYNMLNLSINNITNSNMQTSEYLQNFVMAFYEYVNGTLESYKNGEIKYNQAMEELQLYLSVLPEIAVSYDSEADQILVNNLIDYINGTQQIIHNMNDISTDVSEEAQTSFDEEIEYLESVAETVMSITEFDDGIDEENKEQFIDLATDIWELDIFKYVIPVAAICMVLSVALGVRYKL